LHTAQEPRVVMKEAYIRCAGRHDVPGWISGKKSFAVNQGQVAGLAWLNILVGDSRLWIRRGNLYQFVMGNDQFCAHALDHFVIGASRAAALPPGLKQAPGKRSFWRLCISA